MGVPDPMTNGIRCFAPKCQEEGVVLALDESVSCFVSFCAEHEDEWLAVDHISEIETND